MRKALNPEPHSSKFNLSTRRRRGQALVEMAFSIIFLLTMLIGIMEFGWLVRNNYALANASREGARFGALGKTIAQTQDRVRATSPLAITNSDIILTYYDTTTATWVAWPVDVGTKNGVPIDAQLRVSIRTSHRALTGFLPFLRSKFITQYTVMRREL